MAARLIGPGGGELIGYTGRWSVAPGERIALMASSSASPVTVRLVRLRHGDPNPAGPGLRAEPVPCPVDGEYPCGRQTIRSGSRAVLDDAGPAGSRLSVWAWTRVPARGRRQVLLARGDLELFLGPEGLPSVRAGEAHLSARQPLGRESWTELGVSVTGSTVALQVAGEGGMVPAGQAVRLDEADTWLSVHPEAGLSAYDRHADGSGCSLVSMRRPVPNFRPDFVWWNTGAPERFSADLYITDFLDHRGEAWDAFTDHDLHRQGAELLRRYKVILTGTHPEYCTREMLAALRQYLDTGGRVM